MTTEQIIEYLEQRLESIKNNLILAQEQNNKDGECWYTAQYQEVSSILKAIE